MRQTFQQNTNGISFTVLVIFILAILSGDAAGQNLTFPAYFDWHNKNGTDWMTPVKNQGGCASCWAFSAVGVVEAVFNIYNNNPNLDLDLSEQQLVSSNGVCCSYCGNCSGGRSLEALEYIRDTGIVDEACFPYTSANSNCSLCSNWTNRKYHINDCLWSMGHYRYEIHQAPHSITW
jgi:C1A family cysteine protease